MSFIMPIAIIGIFCLVILAMLFNIEWTRIALLKGLACCTLGYLVYKFSMIYGPLLRKLKAAWKGSQNSKAKQAQSK